MEALVTTELDTLDLDLVELRIAGSRARPVLDVRIDRRDGRDVQVGDCERASRAIEAGLDAAPELMSGRYVLEVSSPGMERALHAARDWRRFLGRAVRVRSARFASVGGYLEGDIVEVTGDGAEARVVVRDGKGVDHQLVLADVQDARLAFHWQP